MPEVRRLLQLLTLPAAEHPFHLRWSWWRRMHQAVARRCHTSRRARSPSAPAWPVRRGGAPLADATGHAPGPAAPTTAPVHLSDGQWARVAALLPVATGGRPARHQRRQLDGLLWLRHTGAGWRSLPAEYGSWQTLYARYRRWRATGTWQRLRDLLTRGEPEVSL